MSALKTLLERQTDARWTCPACGANRHELRSTCPLFASPHAGDPEGLEDMVPIGSPEWEARQRFVRERNARARVTDLDRHRKLLAAIQGIERLFPRRPK